MPENDNFSQNWGGGAAPTSPPASYAYGFYFVKIIFSRSEFIADFILRFNFTYVYFAEGKKHDAGMLAESGLLQSLEVAAFSTTGQPMCLYDDPAYPLRVHLQAPFRGVNLTNQMKVFNTNMSATRVSVEWLFGDIINYLNS